MSQVNYKSTRLLVEAVDHEMKVVRKAAMGNMEAGALNELRDLVDQLAKKAERVALEDLTGMAETDPDEYVAAMMPFVAEYHRLLAPRDLLAPCLCRDLRVGAVVVILVGDDKSVVRTAHDPSKPEAALVVEALLASLDGGAKQVTDARVEELAGAAPLDAAALQEETFAGIDRQAALRVSEDERAP